MSNPVLIGTGFYANPDTARDRGEFAWTWYNNTKAACRNIVGVDNSEAPGLNLSDFGFCGLRVIPIKHNLGCAGTPPHLCGGTPLLGWSVSWLIPALIAYSEKCDFVYKEQDCLAFGDWLDAVRVGRMSFGRSSTMQCEQSLFFIRHDFILEAIRLFMNIRKHDVEYSTEGKFRDMMDQDNGIVFHDLPGGRDRPIPITSKAFYLQRITPGEMGLLHKIGLI